MNEVDLDQIGQFASLFQSEKVGMFLLGMAFLVGLVKLLKFISKPIYDAFPARRLLISQVLTVFNFLAYILGTSFLFFAVIQPPKELMLAAGGSVAVALGLSLKDLVASVVAGLILLFDRPFQVGDRVSFNGTYGEIKAIGLRAVRLVTLDDNLVTIPNSRFITDVVASGNAGELDMMIVTTFHLAADADIKKARDLLFEIVATSRFAFLKKPIAIVANENLQDGRPVVSLMAKAYVIDVQFEKAFETDIYLRANQAFREAGIERPRARLEMVHQ
ncbi:MAG: mechanosensitive ion channel [Bdellovibrionaceae bacterium]|nr:mechanosensitive ion channel [Bdellovibrionales bacterium]MCB9083155.1 mechanosensitive ion channel [Pseudobdellovibrionaceae bacterium]